MTKQELIDSVAKQTGCHKEATRLIIETAAETIIEAVAQEETVFLRGFGAFMPKRTKAKVGRNICAGTSLNIPERTKPAFKPYREFRERVEEATSNNQ